MEAKPVRTIEYYDGMKQSVIPLFQRPYIWNKRNWSTLWDDILTQYDGDNLHSHFMGAIVTISVNSVPVGVNKHLVIDGQQRLTTLAIFLMALRDSFPSTESTESKRGIINDYLVNRHYSHPDKLKLVPTQGDRRVFSALVEQKNIIDRSHRIAEAYHHFLNAISKGDLEGNVIDLDKLLTTVQQCLRVVMINLDDSDDPYLIFESLNYKGEPLSESDLVRNYVLMRFQHSIEPGGEQEQVYLEFWKPMEDSLDPALTEFLRHYAMRMGSNVRKGGIYSATKEQLETRARLDVLKRELASMRDHSRFYQKFLQPASEADMTIQVILENLRDLDSTTLYPLMLRFFEKYECGAIDAQELVKSLRYIEAFILRRSVCGVPTNALNKLGLQWCSNFPDSDFAIWLLNSLKSGKGGSRCPSDTEFSNAILRLPQYGKNATRYVLENLELDFEHQELVDASTATIEHVMPQTLNELWRRDLGNDPELLHQTWLHTMGNLTLSAYNSEMGNNSFEEKKAVLAQSHFELNRWIAEQIVWGSFQIEQRGKTLAEMALKRWPVN